MFRKYSRFIAAVVVCFFTWSSSGVYSIANAAAIDARTSKKKTPPPVNAKTPEKQSDKTNKKLSEPLADSTVDIKKKKEKLKTASAAIEVANSEMRKEFAETEKRLRDANLPAEILERHRTFVKHYDDNLSELKGTIERVGKARDRKEAEAEIGKHLEKLRAPSRHQKLGSSNLPHRQPKAQKREPRMKKEEFDRDLMKDKHVWNNQKRIQVASAGSLAGLLTSNAVNAITPPTAEDLSETIEVQLTPEIRAKALELGNNPVKIYEWVRNNIEFVPTWGSIQGARMTMLSKQGNAFDTASLLIALLRASGIHARYVMGTIELPIAKIMDWAGGFFAPGAALKHLSSGGIPVAALTSGGAITSARMEHMWVEAWIDYNPSRGARHVTGNTWIPLDASFKQNAYGKAIDIKTSVPFDAQMFQEQITSSATTNEPESYATGVNCGALQQISGNYQASVGEYLERNFPNADVETVLGKKTISRQEFPYLLGTLPYQVSVAAERIAEIPDGLRHTITFRLADDAGTSIDMTRSLPEIAGKKMTIDYRPATQADEETIKALLPALQPGATVEPSKLPVSLPAYLIHVKPEIRINGVVAASGTAIGLGKEESLSTVFAGPNFTTDTIVRTITAGEYAGVAVDTGGVSQDQLQALKAKLADTRTKLQTNATAGLTKDDIAGDAMYAAALSYFAERETKDIVKAKNMGIATVRLPSASLFSHQLNATLAFGEPLTVSAGGLGMDILRSLATVTALDDSNQQEVRFTFISGMDSAALTHLIPGDLFLTPADTMRGISAVSTLQVAKDAGIPVYSINQNNVATVLPNVQAAADTKTNIENAVNAGYVVVVPKSPVTFEGKPVLGYIVINPNTGDIAANIEEDISGGIVTPSWSGMTPVITIAGDGTIPWLTGLASTVISEPFVTALQSVMNGTGDFMSGVPATNLAALTSVYFYNATAAELSCYLNETPASVPPDRPTGTCMAEFLGAICIASNAASVSTGNTKPVANAGTDQSVTTGNVVTLDASGSSDADHDALTYAWTLTAIPQGSSAVLKSATTVAPTFIPDLPGAYTAQLVVHDGKVFSDPAIVTITAARDLVTVPDLVGKPQQDAEMAIMDTGLRFGTVSASSSATIAKGSVISQNPAASAVIAKGSLVDITVSTGPAVDTEPPELNVQLDRTPAAYAAGESIVVYIDASDNSNSVNVTMTVDGTATPVTLPQTTISTTGFAEASTHSIVVTAVDPSSNGTTKTLNFGIKDPAKSALPDIAIITPAADTEISVPTTITGTVKTPNLLQYTLSYSPAGKTSFTVFATGTSPVTNGALGTLDPTLLKNGIYVIRLTATDTNGKSMNIDVTYRVTGDMKVGNFTVTFSDLNIPVAGLPITVNRTYDSRDKTAGDFGVGWRVDMQNVKIDENRTPGEGWPQTKSGGAFGTYCLNGDSEHYVSIALPDGRTEEFDMTLTPSCQRLSPVEETTPGFVARAGTTSTLAPSNATLLVVAGDQLLDMDTVMPYDPSGYILTTADGMVFNLDQNFGIRSAKDPNGNTVTYSASGITHSAGKGVSFTRDGKGRITKITAPDNSTILYAYDADGNLASMTDQAGNVTTYAYNRSHGLTGIKDPRGNTPIRNEYDSAGRLVAHIDSYGKRIEYTHDITGRQEVVKDRNGNLTVFVYDEKGRVLKKTGPLGNATSYTYDSVGNKLSETDPLGNTTNWTYDAKKNVLSESKTIDGKTLTTSHTYNSLNKVLTTTDPLGHVSTNTYDTKGNLLTATDAKGNTTTNTYDTRGNLLTTKDALGNTATNEYDAYGNLTKQTNAAGAITTYTYDVKGNRLAEKDPKGNTTLFAYDKNGKLASTTTADGAVTKTEYDAVGNKVADINPLGYITRYYYDSANRLVSTEYPDGTATKTVFDNEGNRIASVDQEGRTTRYEYNGSKQLVKTLYADGSTRQLGYDASGRQTTTTDALSKVATKEYDVLGRVTKNIDADSNTTTFEYDLAGNQAKHTDANGHATTFVYDENNRLITTRLSGGQTTTTEYDALGRKKSETDAAGNKTQFDYDATGNLTKVADAEGGITQYEYDQNNNRTAIVDARDNRTAFAFDNLNRLISKTMPNGGVETYVYDAAGRQISRTDAKGQAVQYAYDPNGRLITRAYPDNSAVRFSYTDTGKRAIASDKRGTTSYAYDGMNRLKTNTYPDGNAINYGYDAASRIATLSSALSGTISYAYYNSGRLKEVKDPQGKITSYTYDGAGNRTGLTYPNSTTVSYVYDTNNRLTTLTHRNALSETMASYVYTLGAIGNRTRIDESTGISRQYQYDQLYRLTSEQVSDPTNAQTYQNDFTYDGVGNRLNKTNTPYNQPAVSNDYTYNAADQLLTENGVTYTYDLNGNLESKTDANGATTYGYDYDNRLVKVVSPSGTTAYEYDADGTRVSSTAAAGKVKYLVDTTWSLSQVLAEYKPDGTLIASYVYADDLISMNRNGASSFYHFDGLGSTRLLTDSSGAVTDNYDYDAFGNLIARTGSTENPFLFTGQQYDANTGFYHLRARYYQPSSGKFITVDPYEGDVYAPTSLHKYFYSSNDPVNRIDPNGMDDFSLSGLMLSISIQAVSLGARFPVTTSILTFVARSLIPAEVEMSMGPSFGNAIYHSNIARDAASKGLKFATEAEFQKYISDMGIFRGALREVGIAKDGLLTAFQRYVPKGGRIIDFFWKESLIEIKMTAKTIDLDQAEVFIKAASNNGLSLHYWFLHNPEGSEIFGKLIQRGKQLGVDIVTHYIYK